MTDEKKPAEEKKPPSSKLALTLGMLAALVPPDPRAGRERERIEQDLANARRLEAIVEKELGSFPPETKAWKRRTRQLEEVRARILELRGKVRES